MLSSLAIEPHESAAIKGAYEWMVREFGAEESAFEFCILLDPDSPWLVIVVHPSPTKPHVSGSIPERYELALWRQTGAVHVLANGRVEDPPILNGVEI